MKDEKGKRPITNRSGDNNRKTPAMSAIRGLWREKWQTGTGAYVQDGEGCRQSGGHLKGCGRRAAATRTGRGLLPREGNPVEAAAAFFAFARRSNALGR